MDDKLIHVYTEIDLLRYLVTNNFKNDNTCNPQNIETIEVSGVNIRNHSFKIKFIGIKSFKQLGVHEADGRCHVSIMVFAEKKQRESGMKVLTVTNGNKEILYVNTLRKLCFSIPALVRKHVVLGDLADRDRLYKMDARPRGLCVIINNKTFEDANGNDYLPYRMGSDIDAQNLKRLFQSFAMDVKMYVDLSDCDIIKETKKISLKDHSDYDMFVCCILSHGKNGSVLGVNNSEVPILEITSTFRNRGCPSLAGKPKLFFIQACQGERPQRGFVQTDVILDEEFTKVLPDGSDFLIACSTEPGYESFRHTSTGSYFVNSLVKQLRVSANRSLVDILTDVCNEVSDQTFDNNRKQVPWFTSTLRKTLIFNQCNHYVNV
ncbi:caspase-3-like [Haliotis asinina]|uniref:caspase-3-like n=1 Tax=Haliotis asinina TaxID=109174 RepID=UPI0035326FCD